MERRPPIKNLKFFFDSLHLEVNWNTVYGVNFRSYQLDLGMKHGNADCLKYREAEGSNVFKFLELLRYVKELSRMIVPAQKK